jgi:hypothetical protein
VRSRPLAQKFLKRATEVMARLFLIAKLHQRADLVVFSAAS